jgi:hypothetical protein
MSSVFKYAIVRVSKNTIPAISYSHYLTHSSRARIKNSQRNEIMIGKQIFPFVLAYLRRKNDEPHHINFSFNEMIVTFSRELNNDILKETDIDRWTDSFMENIFSIIEKSLPNNNVYYFAHQKDKVSSRVHLHILFSPYIKSEKYAIMEDRYLCYPKVSVDKDVLNKIKQEIEAFAQEVVSSLRKNGGNGVLLKEARDVVTISNKEEEQEDLSQYFIDIFGKSKILTYMDEDLKQLKLLNITSMDFNKEGSTYLSFLNFILRFSKENSSLFMQAKIIVEMIKEIIDLKQLNDYSSFTFANAVKNKEKFSRGIKKDQHPKRRTMDTSKTKDNGSITR